MDWINIQAPTTVMQAIGAGEHTRYWKRTIATGDNSSLGSFLSVPYEIPDHSYLQ